MEEKEGVQSFHTVMVPVIDIIHTECTSDTYQVTVHDPYTYQDFRKRVHVKQGIFLCSHDGENAAVITVTYDGLSWECNVMGVIGDNYMVTAVFKDNFTIRAVIKGIVTIVKETATDIAGS